MAVKKSPPVKRPNRAAKPGSAAKKASARSALRDVARSAARGKLVVEEAAAVATVQQFFRTFDLGSELELAEHVRLGIPTETVDYVLSAGILEPQVFYDHVAPRRTLSHRKGTERRLSPEQSDRFARVLRLHARAQEALGDADRAARWLRKANRALNGKCPIDLLGTDAGTRAVEQVLGRIEHGVYS